nr:hypothetical protein CFP56_09894 [Quercus suber]
MCVRRSTVTGMIVVEDSQEEANAARAVLATAGEIFIGPEAVLEQAKSPRKAQEAVSSAETEQSWYV